MRSISDVQRGARDAPYIQQPAPVLFEICQKQPAEYREYIGYFGCGWTKLHHVRNLWFLILQNLLVSFASVIFFQM
ncbi:hypothetical protein C492_02337 [Natronococcus jeotgali DSM 18795]|uniref:Uncharacterized protein n=1 Tax=Natronococcus jeotgali DSM 18795 TaxID=1227498 RepID=L9XW91_9EURY|nr:hypothetical protein C492_02337 [Natronococcus jeotgali DSM 18795]